MKSSPAKPRPIKRNPAKQNYFHHRRLPDFNKPPDSTDRDHRGRKFKAFTEQKEKKFDIRNRKHQPSRSDSVSEKNWWTPVWSGLVLESSAKHRTAIRQAIWLYLYLLTVANRQTGTLFRRVSTIAKETGFQPRSIQRWLKLLRDENYIDTYSNGRFLNIEISKWKPITRREKPKSDKSFDR